MFNPLDIKLPCFVECPKCGCMGKLVTRSRNGKGCYWQVRHGDDYCYIGKKLSLSLRAQLGDKRAIKLIEQTKNWKATRLTH